MEKVINKNTETIINGLVLLAQSYSKKIDDTIEAAVEVTTLDLPMTDKERNDIRDELMDVVFGSREVADALRSLGVSVKD